MKKPLYYLVCILLLTARSVAQTYNPVTVTGFNWDGIAESVPAASSTTGAIDRTNHVMYDVNYAASVGSAQGLPSGGTITSGTRTYQLQSYTGNNTVYLTGGQTDSLVLATPAAFTYISLLCFATETQSTNTITLRFTDGTIATYTSVAIKDWFSGTPYIISGFDRTDVLTDQPDFNTINPRMYALDYTLSCANQLKLLRSIVINNTSAGFPRTCVMALSGVAAPTFSFTNTNPSCPTSNNGQATVNASGGAGGFTYTWSTTPAQSSATATSLLPGPYTVSVVSGGCTFPEHDTLTATGNSTPITVTASPDSICPGGSSTLTVNGAVSFVWSGGTPSGNTDLVSPTSTTTYSVTATNSGGCTGTAAISVTVNPIPPAPTITAGGPTTFCQGGSVVLSSSAATGNTWSTSATTPSITVPSSGTFTVTQTLLGCTSPPSAPAAVVVNPIPAAPTITASGPTTFCQGDSVILTSSAPSGNVWSDGSTNVSDTVRASGTFTVTQTVSGCTSPASAPITVTVNPIPAAPTISGSPLSFCQGDSVILTSSAASGNTWSNGSTTVSDTIRTSGTYTVTQTLLGCTSPASSPVTVTVNPIPAAPTISGAPLTFCQGDSVILTSSDPSGNVWSDGSTNASDTIRTSGTYTVTETLLGCTSLPSAPVTVTVNPIPPAPTITASGPTAICIGNSVTLTSSATSGNVWSTAATSQSITESTAGPYTVTQTLLGCTSPPSAPTTVTIIPLPQVTITPSQPDVCPGSPVTLTANPTGASAYVWNDASTLPTLSISTAGTYSVSVTVNGCVGSGSIVMASKPLLGTLSLPDSSTICSGDSVTIDATTLNATAYQWSINDTTPTVNLQTEGSYTVTVSNSCGTASKSTYVIVKNCNCNIYMPDAFTPNGDGRNDSIGVLYDCPNVKYVKLAIFNRWGETVYESTDLNAKWDGTYKGTQVPAGVYVYFVSFTGATNTTEHTYNLQGSITVIR